MKKTHIFLILLIIMFLVLPRGCGGIFSGHKVTDRDTTIYNVTYRDSVIYNVVKKDSTIIDYDAVPLTDFDTLYVHDTTYIAIPIASYHFSDTMSDIWATGYRVTLDSVRYHLAERESIIFVESRKRWLTADVGGSLIRFPDVWTISADVRASARINELWSVDGRVGIAVGDKVSPYIALGARRTLGAE